MRGCDFLRAGERAGERAGDRLGECAGERPGDFLFDPLAVLVFFFEFDEDNLLGALTPGVRPRGDRSG